MNRGAGPADIPVTGYDNTFLAGIDSVSLTSVDSGPGQIGRIEASWLASRDTMPAPGTASRPLPP